MVGVELPKEILTSVNSAEYFHFDQRDFEPTWLVFHWDGKFYKIHPKVVRYLPKGFNIHKLEPEKVGKLLDELSRLSEKDFDSKSISEKVIKPEEEPDQKKEMISEKKEPITMPGQDLAPKCQVIVGSASGDLKFSTFYHEIIRNPPFVIFAVNTSVSGYTLFIPERNKEYFLAFPNEEKNYRAFSLGKVFSHNGFDYYIMMLRDWEETRESG